MANINLMDRIPDTGLTLLSVVLSRFEDPVGLERPLWHDLSSHQGWPVRPEVLVANGALGLTYRGGISWGYTDRYFQLNWDAAGGLEGVYRNPYFVPYPDQPVLRQVDSWFRILPEIDVIPRMIDLEVSRSQPASKIADVTWEMSELIKSRDGFRPWIYSRKDLIDSWLASWSTEMLNDHFWELAQYLWDRLREHPGPPTLPARVRKDRVLFHQTADKKPAPAGAIQSKSIDWGRFEKGSAADLHQLFRDEYDAPGPVPSTWAGEITDWARTVDPPYTGPDPYD